MMALFDDQRLRTAALLVVAGCASGPASQSGSASTAPTTRPPKTAVEAPRSRISERGAPYDGVYYDPSNRGYRASCSLAGSWMASESGLFSVVPVGQTLKPLLGGASFALKPPARPGEGWTLTTPSGVTLEQRYDPYLLRVEEHLANHTFTRIDPNSPARSSDDASTSDNVAMTGAVFAKITIGDRCSRVFFVPDSTRNGSIPLRPPSPVSDGIGVRTFLLLKLENGCDEPLDVRTRPRVRGLAAAGTLFADAAGEPLGLVLEGYMFAEVYAVPDVDRATLERLLQAGAKAGASSAE
jgi:hypothetical protein